MSKLKSIMIWYRDKKLVTRVNKYWKNTSQRLTDENALQDASFFNLEDDVIESYRPYSRMLPYHIDHATASILQLRNVLKSMIIRRRDEDLDVLDTVIETQQLLQQIVILHFGLENDEQERVREEEIIQRIKFPKLTQRLLKPAVPADIAIPTPASPPPEVEAEAISSSSASPSKKGLSRGPSKQIKKTPSKTK
jgi:hypothetical protein